MRGFAQTVADWLPHPVYPFVGGPKDGQSLTVNLHETEHGLVPSPHWRVEEDLGPVRLGDPVPETVALHTYRFVPDRGSINQGHYVWVPQ